MAPLPLGGKPCLPPLETNWLEQLGKAELSVHSQNGEDGVLLGILLNIGSSSHYYVEFGTQDGSQCNTRVLREDLGWRGTLMDGSYKRPEIGLHREIVTPDNINALLSKYVLAPEAQGGSPGSDAASRVDVLSIDIDYSDWYVWRAINGSLFAPRVVIIEYNGAINASVAATVDIADSARWTGTNYFGASLRAMADLGTAKGYSLVYADSEGVNAFFVRSDILTCQGVSPPPLEKVWRPARYGPHGRGHGPERNSSRQWQLLDAEGRVIRRQYVADWLQ